MSPTTISHPACFGPAFAHAKVDDAMRVGLVTCRPSASPTDAARMMAGYGIHCLIVADPASGGHALPLGMVDALDVARGEADGRERIEGRTSHLIAVQPGTDLPVGIVQRVRRGRRARLGALMTPERAEAR